MQYNSDSQARLPCTSEATGESFGNQMVSKCRSSPNESKSPRGGAPRSAFFKKAWVTNRTWQEVPGLWKLLTKSQGESYTLNIMWSPFEDTGDFRISQCPWVNIHPTDWLVTVLEKSESKEKFTTDFLVSESWKNQLLFYYQIQRAGFLPEEMQAFCLLCKREMF